MQLQYLAFERFDLFLDCLKKKCDLRVQVFEFDIFRLPSEWRDPAFILSRLLPKVYLPIFSTLITCDYSNHWLLSVATSEDLECLIPSIWKVISMMCRVDKHKNGVYLAGRLKHSLGCFSLFLKIFFNNVQVSTTDKFFQNCISDLCVCKF